MSVGSPGGKTTFLVGKTIDFYQFCYKHIDWASIDALKLQHTMIRAASLAADQTLTEGEQGQRASQDWVYPCILFWF